MTPVIAVAGLGLMGGSLARDLTASGATVLGYDVDSATTRAALAAGAIAAALGPGLEGIEKAEILVLATPPAATLTFLETLAPTLLEASTPAHREPGGAPLSNLRLVTDLSSTKAAIVAAAERLGLGPTFVGGHPLTGDHRAGWSATRHGLFRGARVFLTPTATTSAATLATASALWERVGALTEVVDAAEHDRLLARTSHLPQATSSALALTLAAKGIGPADLGPGGRDATRLAASSPALWTEIVLANATHLAPALQELEGRLRELRHALDRADRDKVRGFFAASREWAGNQAAQPGTRAAQASTTAAMAPAGRAGGFPPGG